jgi:dynactin complex subunit
MSSKEEDVRVGQKVVILGKRKGTVRFIGQTAFGPGEWVGVELDKPTGTHDGLANGHRYFNCPPGHGVYVQRQGVLPSTSWQVNTRIYTQDPRIWQATNSMGQDSFLKADWWPKF